MTVRADFPSYSAAQTQYELKELLYRDIINYFDKGKVRAGKEHAVWVCICFCFVLLMVSFEKLVWNWKILPSGTAPED